jgi:hypothetical protein
LTLRAVCYYNAVAWIDETRIKDPKGFVATPPIKTKCFETPRRLAWIMDCRIGCGACCIALSISSPIPGMPNGKPAGVRCVQLTDDNRCAIFDSPERPVVCARLRPMRAMCGDSFAQAMAYLEWLERETTAAA